MISNYHNHGGSIPEMLPVKNRDGTFTICYGDGDFCAQLDRIKEGKA